MKRGEERKGMDNCHPSSTLTGFRHSNIKEDKREIFFVWMHGQILTFEMRNVTISKMFHFFFAEKFAANCNGLLLAKNSRDAMRTFLELS